MRPGLWDHDLRRLLLPPVIDVIDGLLSVGATLLYAPPGLGKTWLAGAVEHHLAYGSPLKGWDPPETLHRCLVVDAESDLQLAQERSFALTRHLPTDGAPGSDEPIGPAPHGIKFGLDDQGMLGAPGTTGVERFAYLRSELELARAEGNPFRYVRIDTMRIFCGGRPRGFDIAEWDNMWAVNFNRLALEFDAAIVLLHHTNKAMEYSGSTGIGGGVTTVMSLAKNPENEYEIVLKSEKVRRGRPFEYALIANDEGVPQFTDTISPAQAGSAGTNRAVIDALTARPRTMAELCRTLYDLPKSTVRRCVQRLQRTEPFPIVRYYKGQYEVTQAHTHSPAPAPAAAEPEIVSFCDVCHDRLIKIRPEQRVHPTCAPHPIPGPEPTPEPEPEPDTAPTPGKWNAFTELKDSIERSRLHPIRFIPLAERETGIWPMFTALNAAGGHVAEGYTGEHRWRLPINNVNRLPDDHLVAVLDKSGSYPAACSSTVVAPNRLRHVGPLDNYQGLAGMFGIQPFAWTDPRIGHPLGPIGDDMDAPIWWISTPHLHLLRRLSSGWSTSSRPALRGPVIDPPIVLDAWCGNSQGNLFAQFSTSVRDERDRVRGDTDAYIAVKRSSSQALRSLWSQTRSPFWRPDWSIAIRAEAAVRLWAAAYTSVLLGETLLALKSVDESWFLAPAGADACWWPEGYTISASGFGGVKHKKVKLPLPGARRSRGEGLVVPSPITMAQYLTLR